MSEIAIRIEGLGKQYRISQRDRYPTLRSSLMNALSAPFRRIGARAGRQASAAPANLFWALRDVAFDINHGEVVGVIGRNGAGKSTLLKILSRITDPTEGRVELHGRVGSLLEVGTGFHPELTGRDNIFLNGAILGMRKRETARKFDEIVAFAEVEPFIDTPVKHFSSGMYVRLAFAVAAHLEPEILVVDEVLAVGDAEFQKKCLGKMERVAQQGRTVLLVTHNMTTIDALCSHVVWLDQGRLRQHGTPSAVVRAYMERSVAHAQREHKLGGRSPGSSPAVMTDLVLLNHEGVAGNRIRMNESLTVQVQFQAGRPLRPLLGIAVKTAAGSPLFAVNNRFIPMRSRNLARQTGVVTARFDRLPLMPGVYLLDLTLGDEFGDYDVVPEAATFEVVAADVYGSGKLGPESAGPVCWRADFQVPDGLSPGAAPRATQERSASTVAV